MSTIRKAKDRQALVAEASTPPRFIDLFQASRHPGSTLHRRLSELLDERLVTRDERTSAPTGSAAWPWRFIPCSPSPVH